MTSVAIPVVILVMLSVKSDSEILLYLERCGALYSRSPNLSGE